VPAQAPDADGEDRLVVGRQERDPDLLERVGGLPAGGQGLADLEDPGDEIGPEAPGSPHMGLWFHDPDGYRWELSVQDAAE
jgi:catechol 2,3-dioxygenase-like lactoylglutathione lyase family enzyme